MFAYRQTVLLELWASDLAPASTLSPTLQSVVGIETLDERRPYPSLLSRRAIVTATIVKTPLCSTASNAQVRRLFTNIVFTVGLDKFHESSFIVFLYWWIGVSSCFCALDLLLCGSLFCVRSSFLTRQTTSLTMIPSAHTAVLCPFPTIFSSVYRSGSCTYTCNNNNNNNCWFDLRVQCAEVAQNDIITGYTCQKCIYLSIW